MPEFKNGFDKAKMNKDSDERLVANGEYRDANNIQVSTSEGSNVGVAQNISGNKQHATIDHTANAVYGVPTTSTCVASISSDDRDKIYYFVSAGDINNSYSEPAICKDYILEYDVITEKTKYVFVDIYKVTTKINGLVDTASTTFKIDDDIADSPDNTTTQNRTGIRIGMQVISTAMDYSPTDNIFVTDIRYNSGWEITVNKPITWADNNDVIFTSERVLEFNKDIIITGINILDDFIFWTDNYHEPKKINITRSIAGTGGVEYLVGGGIAGYASATTTDTDTIFEGDTDYFHTRLVRPDTFNNESRLITVTNPAGNQAVYTTLANVTVIRPAPTQPLHLQMYRGNDDRIAPDGTEVSTTTTFSDTNNPFWLGSQTSGSLYDIGQEITITFNSPVYYIEGDEILFTFTGDAEPSTTYGVGTFADYDVKCKVVGDTPGSQSNPAAGVYTLEIVSINTALIKTDNRFAVRLNTPESLFEFKFPRFSYRYKYVDGEYSPFAPFSEVAFLPDRYSYEPKDGFNFGMVNQMRTLNLKYYHYDYGCIPEDIQEIDILYKETNNPAVFIVKTLKRSDALLGNGTVWPNLQLDANGRGSFRVTTDMIHSAVPSNQLLRPWDNVPIKALAQEVSANRLIYGNYVQTRDVLEDPIVTVGLLSDKPTPPDFAKPSVKSLRTYQVGLTFSDRYGRETPILTGLDENGNQPNTITVSKEFCGHRNRLGVTLSKFTTVPDWAEYMTYYVKETSVEYYTLSSDRWYAAEDGNIWLSFPSSERNKINEEEFIELKKQHGSNQAVTAPARYKVLAIENEAPSDIRTTRSWLGSVVADNNGPGGNIIGNTNGIGYPTENFSYIWIDTNVLDNNVDMELISGSISITINPAGGSVSGVVEASQREYRVSGMVEINGQYTQVNLTEPFGPEIGWAENSTISVQFLELKEENLPEFDGRFFVKIARDGLLNSYLIAGSDAITEEQLLLVAEHDIGYINNMGYQENDYGDMNEINQYCNEYVGGIEAAASYWNQYNDRYTTERSFQPNEYSGNWDGVGGQDQYEWSRSDLTDVAINRDPTAETNDGREGHTAAKEFWESVAYRCEQGYMFIDACTAFSWTGKNDDQPGNVNTCGIYGSDSTDNGQDGNWSQGGYHNPSTVGPGWEQTSGDYLHGMADEAPDDLIPGGGVSNLKNNNGVPSRGIWAGGYIMDLAWSGMGTGFNDTSSSVTDHPVNVFEMSDSQAHTNCATFMETLTVPGTMFRFKRDPDDIVDSLYIVQSFHNNADWGTNNLDLYDEGTLESEGGYGIRNYATSGGLFQHSADKRQHYGSNIRQRWSIQVNRPIGGSGYRYSPVKGTDPAIAGTNFSTGYSDNPTNTGRRALHHDFKRSGTWYDTIQIYQKIDNLIGDRGHFTKNPAVWETIPKESVELDIYYQATGLIPLWLNDRTNEEVIPIGATIQKYNSFNADTDDVVTVDSWANHNTVNISPALTQALSSTEQIRIKYRNNYERRLILKEAAAIGATQLVIRGDNTDTGEFDRMHINPHILDWNNCWSFCNGVESDRIRDDFNAPQMDNGVRVSSGIAGEVRQERRKHGLIWSGVYNSNAGINDTNQFIMAESITKDLNPVYGSIQRMLNRNTRLIMFCEDKILRAVTNRDLLFNADGNAQLVASNKVIGDVQAYQGDYGIATNPESMSANPYAVYFTDAVRGKVLRLTTEGVVPISDAGMKDYFADLFRNNTWRCLGTFDQRKNEYNLTVSKKYTPTQVVAHDKTTVTYNDNAKGWSSFKSFIPEHGATINNNYYTFYDGQLYKHHDETSLTYYATAGSSANLTMANTVGLEINMLVSGTGIVDGSTITNISANTVTITNAVTSLFIPQNITFTTPKNRFYGSNYTSDITTVFNQNKDTIKSYQTIKYSGSKAAIVEWDTQSVQWLNNNYASNEGLNVATQENDGEYYNLDSSSGWYVEDMTTDLQSAGSIYFKDKEGKYFGYVVGDQREAVDEKEFSVQGIGMATIAHDDSTYNGFVNVIVTNNTSSTYQGTDASGGAWDNAATIADETAKWAVEAPASLTVAGGGLIGASNAQFILSPIINGVYSGTPLAAENLAWAGGADGDNDLIWVDDASAGGDPDDTDTIEKVQFTNTTTAGDPSNKVLVTVHFKTSATWPTSDVVWYIDIDEKAPADIVDDTQPELRDVGFRVYWPYYSTSTPSVSSSFLPTAAQVEAGSSTVDTQWKFTGDDILETNVYTQVAKITYTAATGNFYAGISVGWQGLGGWENFYNTNISDYVTNANGEITSFAVNVYYQPPSNLALQDPPNGQFLSLLGHEFYVNFIVKVSQTPDTDDDIHDVHYPTAVSRSGGFVPIKVYGKVGAKYKICFEQKTSLTDPTTVSSGYYDFERNAFTTSKYTKEYTIGSRGVYNHAVSIPAKAGNVTTDVRYDVTVESFAGSTISSKVPTVTNPGTITQYTNRKVTIDTVTHASSNYGTVSPATVDFYREYDYGSISNVQGVNNNYKKIILTGGNGNTSGTVLTMKETDPKLKVGMRVIAEAYDLSGVDGSGATSGTGVSGGLGTAPYVTHGTLISAIDGRYITLSAAATVPDDTEITFVSGNNVIPFEFTIPPGGGKTIVLKNDVNLRDEISYKRGSVLLDGAVTSGRAYTLDNIKGIRVGDTVTSGDLISDTVKVATLASNTSITLDTDIVLADNTKLFFSSPNSFELINASKVKSGNDIIIRGHLVAKVVEEDVIIPILIDNIITA